MSEHSQRHDAILFRVAAVVFSAMVLMAVVGFWVYRPYGVFTVAGEQPAASGPVNDPEMTFRFGDRVEITAGFFRGQLGAIADVDDDGTFTVAFEKLDLPPNISYLQPRIVKGLNASSMRSIEHEPLIED